MQYITFTELRTKSSQLKDTLKKGISVTLIHRSRVIGKIQPEQEVKPFDAKKFKKLFEGLKFPKTTYSEREKIYRKHLMEKYGKGLS